MSWPRRFLGVALMVGGLFFVGYGFLALASLWALGGRPEIGERTTSLMIAAWLIGLSFALPSYFLLRRRGRARVERAR